VLDTNSRELTPDQLSTGTREQLFLAIRLAYVSQYAQQHEPLPMVLDDVLVNFDEARARAALQALLEFSRLNQIILLTCHRRTVELAQQVHPEIPLSELQVGRLTSPLPVAVESTSPVQPPVEQSRRKATRKREQKSKPLLTDLEEL
jgi:ABC-type ATPase involved in cell division